MGPLRHCPVRRFGSESGARYVAVKLGRSFAYALASFLLIAANLAIFFVWTFPTNQATNNWTVVPKNWNKLRIQWEYSHAGNALVTFVAFCALTLSVLTTRE